MTTATQNVSLDKRIDLGEESDKLLELSETEKAELKALADGDELLRAYELFDTMEREAKAASERIAAHLGYRPSYP